MQAPRRSWKLQVFIGVLALIAAATVSYAVRENAARNEPMRHHWRHVDSNMMRLEKAIQKQIRQARALDVSELQRLLVDESGNPIVIEVHDSEFVIRAVVDRPDFVDRLVVQYR